MIHNDINLTSKYSHLALAIYGFQQQPATVEGKKSATWSYNDPVSLNHFCFFLLKNLMNWKEF